MPSKKHHHQFIDIYNINIHVAVTKSQLKNMKKSIQSLKDPTKKRYPPAGATSSHNGTTDGVNSYHIAFWIDREMWKTVDHNQYSKLAEICAHEAAHAAGMIWNEIGASLDHDTLRDDEPLPYLIGWLTELLMRKTLEE